MSSDQNRSPSPIPLACPKSPSEAIQWVIGLQMDRSEFTTLARVSPTLRALMSYRFFEHLDLSSSAHYVKELPSRLSALEVAELGRLWDHWRDSVTPEIARAQARRFVAIAEKCDVIADRAEGPAFWERVESLRIATRLGGLEGIMWILRRTSPTLYRLELLGTDGHTFREGDIDSTYRNARFHLDISFRTPFEYYIRSTPLIFARLTHLTIGACSLRKAEFIITVYRSAPNITTLIVNLDLGGVLNSDYDHLSAPHLESDEPTKIRRLQVSYGPSSILQVPNPDYEQLCIIILVALIRDSPELEQLAIQGSGDSSTLYIAERILDHPNVRDVAWNASPEFLRSYRKPVLTENLRRLVLRLDKWIDTFDQLPPISTLESLYFDYSASPGAIQTPGLSALSPPAHAQPMLPTFARHLRRYPKLHSIHHFREDPNAWNLDFFDKLDEIDRSGSLSGTVSSMRRGNEEVLFVRICHDLTEIADVDTVRRLPQFESDYWGRPMLGPPTLNEATHHQTEKIYKAGKGSKRTRTYERRSDLGWVTYSDFRKRAVPLEVIYEMKRVEELQVEGVAIDWEQRGVALGHAAWQVLLRWYGEAVLVSETI